MNLVEACLIQRKARLRKRSQACRTPPVSHRCSVWKQPFMADGWKCSGSNHNGSTSLANVSKMLITSVRVDRGVVTPEPWVAATRLTVVEANLLNLQRENEPPDLSLKEWQPADKASRCRRKLTSDGYGARAHRTRSPL